MSFKHHLKRQLTLSSVAILSGFLLASPHLSKAEEISSTPNTTSNTEAVSPSNTETSEATAVQFQVDDIVAGSNVITGTAPFEGSVYAFVNGQIATEKADIVDGKFEITFLPTQAERVYQENDRITLSFIIDDKPAFLSHHTVNPTTDDEGEEAGNEADETLYLPQLTSTGTRFVGSGPADHQLLLYHVDSLEFVQEAIIDQDGKYAFELANLTPKDKYVLLHRNTANEYTNIILLSVDEEGFVPVDKSNYSLVLQDLGLEDHSDWSGDDNLRLGVGLDEETTAISGYTKHRENTAVLITSSNLDKVFPLVPVDSLGYWGINLEDLTWALEAGEELTFSLVDLEKGELLAQLSETVTEKNAGTPLEEYPFEIDSLTEGDSAIQGKVAPNLRVFVYTNPQADQEEPELLAEAMSDDQGMFSIVLKKPLAADEILYFAGFDEQGTQLAWKALIVEAGEDDSEDTEDKTDTGNTDTTDTEDDKKEDTSTTVTEPEDNKNANQGNTSDKEDDKNEDTSTTVTEPEDNNTDNQGNTSDKEEDKKEDTSTSVTEPEDNKNDNQGNTSDKEEDKKEDTSTTVTKPEDNKDSSMDLDKKTADNIQTPEHKNLIPVSEDKLTKVQKENEAKVLPSKVNSELKTPTKETQTMLPKTGDSKSSLLVVALGLAALLLAPIAYFKKK